MRMRNINDINFDKYRHTPIKVEKVEDTRFDGDHPNGYNPGFVIGSCVINLTLSHQHCCLFVDYGDRWFHTSEVLRQEECEGYDLLHTRNSIYKVTPQFTAIPGVQEKYSVVLTSDEDKTWSQKGLKYPIDGKESK